MKKKIILFLCLIPFLLSSFSTFSFAFDMSYYLPIEVSDLSVISDMRKAVLRGDEEAYSQMYDSLESDSRVLGYDPDNVKTVPSSISDAESSLRLLDDQFFIIPEGMSVANDAKYEIYFHNSELRCEFTHSGWEIKTFCNHIEPTVYNSFPVVATLKSNKDIDFEVRLYSDKSQEYYVAYIPIQISDKNVDYAIVRIDSTEETTSEQPPFEALGAVNIISFAELTAVPPEKTWWHTALPVGGGIVVIGSLAAVLLLRKKKK